MKNIFIITVFALFFSQGCSEDDLCLVGSGTVKEYQLIVDDFENVSLIGPVNLRIIQGSDRELLVEAEEEIFTKLSYEVKNGTLEIGFKENVTCFDTDFGVWVNVTLPEIKKISSSGVSDIVSVGALNLAGLDIDISGTANLELNGQAANHSIKSSGVLYANNFGFIAQNTTIDVSGFGDLEISCTEKLDIDISGAATISYKGNPVITQKASGTLTLIDAN